MIDILNSVMNYTTQLAIQNPKLFHLLIIAASFAIMVKSADLLVTSISDYAKKLGISDYLIGAVVVAIVSSTPEIVSSVTGAFLDDGGIVFGTIIGSNIGSVTFVIGIIALIARKLVLGKGVFEKTKVDVFLLALLPFVVMIDSSLSRIDGVILVISYFIYLSMVWKREGEVGKIKKKMAFKDIYKEVLIFLGTFAVLILSGRWLVFSSIHLSKDMGIPPYYIALVIIGIGSNAPDLSVGIKSILRGHQGVGFGNAIGSVLMKSLLLLGIIALITPLRFSFVTLIPGAVFSVVAMAIVLKHCGKESMSWKTGLMLIGIYCLFLAYELFVG